MLANMSFDEDFDLTYDDDGDRFHFNIYFVRSPTLLDIRTPIEKNQTNLIVNMYVNDRVEYSTLPAAAAVLNEVLGNACVCCSERKS